MSDDRPRPAPAERFASEHLVFDLHAELAALRSEQPPPKHGHRQKTLFKHSGRTVALFALDAGAGLAEHSAGGTVTVQVLEGELEVTVSGRKHALRTGTLLAMAPGIRHDVRAAAAAPAAFLLQVSLADQSRST
jgi:quercetin dioxygenase-like cupin family protein